MSGIRPSSKGEEKEIEAQLLLRELMPHPYCIRDWAVPVCPNGVVEFVYVA